VTGSNDSGLNRLHVLDIGEWPGHVDLHSPEDFTDDPTDTAELTYAHAAPAPGIGVRSSRAVGAESHSGLVDNSLSDGERVLVAPCCVELGISLVSVGTKLAGGRSGSLVVSMLWGGTSAVLKVWSKPHLIAGARKEVRLLATMADQFGDVLPQLITSAQGPGWVTVLLRMYDQVPPATLLSTDEWVAIAAVCQQSTVSRRRSQS
jgi:hypothetical protein